MIEMTLAEIAAAVGGHLHAADGSVRVTGAVEFDSRRVSPGDLFVAFPGESVDGHDFAAAAIATGAVAVLGTRPVPGVPMILVPEAGSGPAGQPWAAGQAAPAAEPDGGALAAMGGLARAVLDRLPGLTVIGLTGSSGKTTTKDLIAGLAALAGPTVAPPGSFNTELGLPYTALKATAATRNLVLEMGSRGIGHLRYLCAIAPPRIGVVLNVGVAHIGMFGSRDNIALAKGELVEALPAGGVAVLNADDHRVRAMADRTRARVVLVGEADDALLRAVDIKLDPRGRAEYTLRAPEGETRVRLAVSGRHQVGNSLAAAAVARELRLPLDRVAVALGELRLASARRMDVFDRADGITVIDDSYNANPASTTVALRALAAIGSGRRTIAVLGYLAELGDFELDGHEQVGRAAAELGIDQLIVVGSGAAPIHAGAVAVPGWSGSSVPVADQAGAIGLLAERLRPGDVVLVKGSRYRTWDVADFLRGPGSGAGGNGAPTTGATA